MIQAYTLLIMALGLLNQLNTAQPSPEFRVQVETVAHQAIDFANNILAQEQVVAVVDKSPVPLIVNSVPLTKEVIKDCNPTLEAQIIQGSGSVDTGIDFTFKGISTFPEGCKLDKGVVMSLQTPTVLYKSNPVSLWKRQVKYSGNGFIFTQGWGTGSGETPSGSFVWTVGDSVTTINL